MADTITEPEHKVGKVGRILQAVGIAIVVFIVVGFLIGGVTNCSRQGALQHADDVLEAAGVDVSHYGGGALEFSVKDFTTRQWDALDQLGFNVDWLESQWDQSLYDIDDYVISGGNNAGLSIRINGQWGGGVGDTHSGTAVIEAA